jgi:hypothetical protein
MIEERVRAEIDARLEEDGIADDVTTPFLRCRVRSPSSQLFGREAILTVWDPSEQQLEVLQQGATVRFKHVVAKEADSDGRLRLSANGRTAMASSPDLPRGAQLARPSEQNSTNVLRLYLMSKRLSVSPTPKVQRVGFRGMVVAVGDDTYERQLYLSDTSHLVVRIDESLQQANLYEKSLPSFEILSDKRSVFCFANLLLCPFDTVQRCAVVIFDEASDFVEMEWTPLSGPQDQIAPYRKVCPTSILRRNFRVTKSSSGARDRGFATALGYISGFVASPAQQLFLRVDCGGRSFETWQLVLSLLPFLADRCKEDGGLILTSEQECKISLLKTLGHILRSSRTLYRFQIRPISPRSIGSQWSEFEVCEIEKVDCGSLAQLYVSACT